MLRTRRLTLRQFAEADLDALATLMSDSRRVAEKNGMVAERETVFHGFPTMVFRITRDDA